MWTQVSFAYSFLLFGVYCFVLPDSSSAVVSESKRVLLDLCRNMNGLPVSVPYMHFYTWTWPFFGGMFFDTLLNQRLKFSSTKELRILASDISSNQDFQNAELRYLAGPLLVPRMPDTDSHRKVQQYIKSHFHNLNWNIEEDTFTDNTPYGVKQFNNIIVTYEPEVRNKLVLACHYESKNMTDKKGNAFIAATDSAIPCTILLDIASKLDCSLRRKRENRKLPLSEDVTIQMIFFDGEEAYKDWTGTDSLYGSRHLANWMRDTEEPNFPGTKRLDNVSLFVLLDLIGTSDVVFKNFFLKTDPHFQHLQKIEKSLKKAGFLNPKGLQVQGVQDKILFSSARPWGGIEDDHKPFLHARPDLPVLHLISAPFPHVWHTMADNAAAINWDVTDNFNRIFRVFVANYLHLPAVVCRK